MQSTMDERKKRVRPSKSEKAARAKQVQRPPRVEPESRFDDLLANLRAPAPKLSTAAPASKPPKQNTPIVRDQGVETYQLEREHDELNAGSGKPANLRRGKSSDPNYCRMTLYLSRDVHRAFKTKSTALDLELSDVLERLIVQWLAIDEISDPYLRHFSVPREKD
jgi:hypothetical protein